MAAGNQYGAVLCGGGPAATGLVLCAAADGRLDELLSRGLCIIEKGRLLGPGALGRYPISANTRGSTFLRCLESIGPSAAFDAVRAAPATRAVERYRHRFPRLPLVAQHLETLGRAVHDVVDAAPGCAVLTQHTVQEVIVHAEGGVTVSADGVDGGPGVTVTADHAVIAMGATPRAQLEELSLLPGLGLRPYRDKLCHAAEVLEDAAGLPVRLGRAAPREVAVIGGSHSAWSAAWMLLHDPRLRAEDGRPPRVTVLHRSPLRFFFWNAARARAAGYVFDEERDVCPRTGMVNRHSGLRSDARALAWAATHEEHSRLPVRALPLTDDPDTRAAAVAALDAAGAVVAAVGYLPRLPRMCQSDGRPLQLAQDAAGALVTDRALLLDRDGVVLPGLLGFGLGAGLPARGQLAGEPSYLGRLDSVSLYQAEVGRLALDALLARAHS